MPEATILNIVLYLPLAGIALLVATPPKQEGTMRQVSLWVMVAQFFLVAWLYTRFDAAVAGLQFETRIAWIPAWGVYYQVGLDGYNVLLVALTAFLGPLVVAGAFTAIRKDVKLFYSMVFLIQFAMLGTFLAQDLFLFYLFWEAMLIPMFLLIGIWGGERRIYATIKFFLYTAFGSILMLAAVIYLVYSLQTTTGVTSFAFADLNRIALPLPVQLVLLSAFGLSFAIKVPIVPFHTWLPDAHVEAPTAGSVILAGVLLKMGTYGFLRFAVPFFPDVALAPMVSQLVVALAVIGIVYGALVAMVQPDIKKLVAYSSVSHLGFVMLGIWAGTVQSVQGALMVMIGHGFSTGALFFLVGMIYERRHTREIAAFGGLARVMPLFSAIFTVVALSSIGLPGLNGFVGEFLVLLGSFGPYPVATTIATTGVIFAAAYLLWALQRIIYHKLDKPENEKLTDLTPRELAVLVPLLAGIVWMGLYPAPVLARMEPAAREYLRIIQPGAVEPPADATAQATSSSPHGGAR